MRFTDIFIRRPVLAVSISLLIIILGLQAISKLAVREYPKMTTTVITVTTAYPGADANLIQAFVTSKIEEAVAQADNVDYMSSSSSPSTSTVTVKMKLNTVLKIQRFLHQPVVRGLCILVSVLTNLMQAK